MEKPFSPGKGLLKEHLDADFPPQCAITPLHTVTESFPSCTWAEGAVWEGAMISESRFFPPKVQFSF